MSPLTTTRDITCASATRLSPLNVICILSLICGIDKLKERALRALSCPFPCRSLRQGKDYRSWAITGQEQLRLSLPAVLFCLSVHSQGNGRIFAAKSGKNLHRDAVSLDKSSGS